MHSGGQKFGRDPDAVVLNAASEVGGAVVEADGEKKEIKALPTSKETIVSHIERSGELDGVKKVLVSLLNSKEGTFADLEQITPYIRDEVLREKVRTYFNVTRVLQQKLEDRDLELAVASARAFQDHLTGLANPGFIQAALESEVARYRRENEQHVRDGVEVKGSGELFAIMFDVDRFKRINDTYGHLVGDAVLKAIAGLIQENIREIDFLARYGGEEFAVILPETDKAGAIMVADRICGKVSQERLKAFDEMVTTAISVGVASFPQNTLYADVLMETADKALYKAKVSGRNRVSWF